MPSVRRVHNFTVSKTGEGVQLFLFFPLFFWYLLQFTKWWISQPSHEQPQRSTTMAGILPYIICSFPLKYSMFMGDILVGVQQGPAEPLGFAWCTR